MNTVSKEAIRLIAGRISYPGNGVTLEGLKRDSKTDLEKARNEYQEVFDSITSDEIREALDEAVGFYLSATIDYYCQLGVKQGIRFILDMLMEGTENGYNA